MANIYCPYCEKYHDIKAKVRMKYVKVKGIYIKFQEHYYQCENIFPLNRGVFWNMSMVLNNNKRLEEAVQKAGIK